MDILKLSFLDKNFRHLGTLELSKDVPVFTLLPKILKVLELDPHKEWHLMLGNQKDPIDIRYSLTDLGVKDGHSVRIIAKVKQLGRYQLGERIGSGGMGVVYSAYDPNLDRKVCIKIVHDKYARDHQMMERFSREARAVARLAGEENIVQVYDFVQAEKGTTSYFVMEYVDGPTLADLIQQRNRLPVEMASDILNGLARALSSAHRNGIIHRDIKPSNILLQNDYEVPGKWIPKLADFGLVHIHEEEGELTKRGMVIGSPYYMSPEQVSGNPLTEQSDIYSLGIVVYEMITGIRPFQGGSTTKVMQDHLETPPPPLNGMHQDITRPIEDVVLKAIQKDPSQRYPNVKYFAESFTEATNTNIASSVRKKALFVSLAIFMTLVMIALGALAIQLLRGNKPARLLFISERDGNAEIYAMLIDGTEQVNLTNSPTDDYWPKSSPDGRQIVFHSYDADESRELYSEIYIMGPDGKNWNRLTRSEGFNKFPDWSPHGQKIVFVSDRDGDYDLYSMDADGSNVRQILNHPGRDYFPAWSPNGSQIIFENDNVGNFDIFIINENGSGLKNLTDHAAQDSMATWSPNGRRIVFTSDRSGRNEIWMMNADGGNVQQLTEGGGQQPSWSEDGQFIVFFSDRDGNQEIYLLEVESGNVRRLTNSVASDRDPSWIR